MRVRIFALVVALAGITLLGPGGLGAGWAGTPPATSKPSKSGKPDPRHTTVTQSHLAREHHARIFMAWGAPWGMPGARDASTWACDDTLAVDTLYLTFDPGEDISALMGIDATLIFHAAPGDTLGPFWDLSRKGVNPYNLRIEFEMPPPGISSPWPLVGVGNPVYQVKGDSARLDLGYFVQASKAGPIFADSVYFFARVMVRQRKPFLSGCRQPVCVDFDHLLYGHTNGDRWINTGERFVSLNSKDGAVCGECRKRPPTEEPMRFGGRYDLNAAPEVPSAAPDTTRR